MILLWLFSFLLFAGFTIYILVAKGMQLSYSKVYYVIQMSPLFTLWLWAVAVPLMIIGSTFLIFLAGALVCFVGAAPNFLGKRGVDPYKYKEADRPPEVTMELKVHMAGSYGAVLFAVLSMIFDFHLLIIPGVFLLTVAGLYFSKWKYRIAVIEFLTFMSMFILLLIKIV